MKLQKFWSRKSSVSSTESSPRSPLDDKKTELALSPKPPLTPSRSQSTEISYLLSAPSINSTSSNTSNNMSSNTSNNMSGELPRHIQELHDAFRQFDTNGDGKISVAELGQMLRCLGENPSEADLESMVREADTDGDGYVCLEEFVSLNTKGGPDVVTGSLASVEELQAVFGVFDQDRNGYISAEELYAVLHKLGEKAVSLDECKRMIEGVDADGDGKVDFEEFKRMMSYRS